MRVLSLFDGIACGRLALERAGIPVSAYFASEISPTAIAVAKRNYPDIVHFGDVRSVAAMARAGVFGHIDLLLAGSPCQGFSSAGKQLNFSDPRSALFFEFVNIKNALNPTHFLLENVKMKKEWLALISNFVGVQPVFIDSRDFSAQSRQRYYWTDLRIAPWDGSAAPSLNDVLLPGWVADRPKSYCIDANYGKGTNFRRYFHCGSRQIVFREGCVPKKPPKEWANLAQRTMSNNWRKLDPVECERLQTLPDGYTDGLGVFDRYHAIGNAWTVDVVTHILRG